MSANGHAVSAEDAAFEAAREKEFYRYWEPIARHYASGHASPISSHDPALAAFAQFAALRLGARRSYISFFDRTSQYILAETSPSLSLNTNVAEDDRDKLWTGAAIFPRVGSICASTARPHRAYATGEGTLQRGANIIPNLKADGRFCEIQKVTDHPRETFYAGVPIQTSKGSAIGSFCVFFDDPTRTDMADSELEFMKHLANTIMMHLEMVRAQAENLRSQDMIRALGSFIVGNSSMDEWWLPPRDRRSGSVVDEGISETLQPSISEQGRIKKNTLHTRVFDSNNKDSDPNMNPASNQITLPKRSAPINKDTTPHATELRSEDRPHIEGSDLQAATAVKESADPPRGSFPEEARKIFERAARIVIESADIDGALFLDASVKSFGGLVTSRKEDTSHKNFTEGTGSMSQDYFPSDDRSGQTNDGVSESTGDAIPHSDTEAEPTCAVLALSTTPSTTALYTGTSQRDPRIPEKFLRSLLRRYPHGHIWSLDEIDVDYSSPTLAKTKSNSSTSNPSSPYSLERHHVKEIEVFRRLFPSARSLALVGLWDSHNDKWFAGSIIWTCDPVRILSHKSELSYLAAFGDSIMAEIARLQVKMADTAKADFISSISHELRSPLHGILGTAECLEDTVLDPFQESLIYTLNTCSKTLLDTIDHLLDFAKINNFTKRSAGNAPAARGRENLRLADEHAVAPDIGLGMVAAEGEIDLIVVSEEVIEAVFAGYDFLYAGPDHKGRANAQTSSFGMWSSNASIARISAANVTPTEEGRGHVSLIVDFAKTADSSWVFQCQAGAWRRVVLNLVGNSLKFTEKGFIKVQLKAVPLATKDSSRRSQVVLTVTDTGIGMSDKFLKERLFSPFTQEDPHRSGTGLGLSLVQQIVTSMGGKIEIQSKKGVGTKITVSIPMRQALMPEASLRRLTISPNVERCNGLRLNAMADTGRGSTTQQPYTPEDSQHVFLQSLESVCRDWLHMKMETVSELNLEAADIFLCTEGASCYSIEGSKVGTIKDQALIILCDTPSTARALRSSPASSSAFAITEIISQPCGPRKLARVITLCLDRIEALKEGDEDTFNKSPTATKAIPIRAVEVSAGASNLEGQALSGVNVDLAPKHTHGSTMNAVSKSLLPLHARATSEPTIPVALHGKSGNETLNGSSSPNHGGLRVLLVDDNRINLQLLMTYMRKSGHRYQSALNGLEAVEAYKDAAHSANADLGLSRDVATPIAFDFVLMDISMPVMDGLEATRRIREFEHEVGMRPATVIALTGLTSVDAKQEAYSSGVNLFLTKPLQAQEGAHDVDCENAYNPENTTRTNAYIAEHTASALGAKTAADTAAAKDTASASAIVADTAADTAIESADNHKATADPADDNGNVTGSDKGNERQSH